MMLDRVHYVHGRLRILGTLYYVGCSSYDHFATTTAVSTQLPNLILKTPRPSSIPSPPTFPTTTRSPCRHPTFPSSPSPSPARIQCAHYPRQPASHSPHPHDQHHLLLLHLPHPLSPPLITISGKVLGPREGQRDIALNCYRRRCPSSPLSFSEFGMAASRTVV